LDPENSLDIGSSAPACSASRLVSPQLSHTALAFCYFGMCKFYLVGRLSRQPVRSVSRYPLRLQPRNGDQLTAVNLACVNWVRPSRLLDNRSIAPL
ncbi:MAG: hypothetical protein ACREDH_05160, partial [Methylocella sp.]